eukprot:5508796-Prymnesium_polylepis.1
MQAERVESDARITALQAQITDLERKELRRQAAVRGGEKQTAAEIQRLEGEVAAAKEGRAWSNVRAAEARAERAEAAQHAAEADAERLEAEARRRDPKKQAEKQELYHLRYTVNELREKVDSYQVRSNRKFFEVEPLAEENTALRGQIAKLEAKIKGLEQIVSPPPSLFYTHREKADGALIGGRRVADDWEMLSVGLAVLMVSQNNVKPVVEAIARFFQLNLPTEQRTVDCPKLGIKKT